MNTRSENIVELFNRAALRHPNDIAVTQGDRCLTYDELHSQSNRLAHYLVKNQVSTEKLVPILLGHEVEAIIAILAVLKAGAAFVPVDPDFPPDRIAYIVEETDCPILITNSRTARLLPGGKYITFQIDTDWTGISPEPDSAPSTRPSAADLAYIIYTSGSTGRPKGVMIEHGQIFCYLLDIQERFPPHECGSYAILGTLAADAAYTAFFLALCYGKSLHLLSIKAAGSFEALVEFFTRRQVDCYKITPSLLQLLIQNKGAEKVLPKKQLILGGENCPAPLVHEVLKILPRGCRIFNHYGPTETTIGVITYEFPLDIEQTPSSIPLGKPLPNVRIHILNDNKEQVRQGQPGELFIEGPLVGRGYLNKADLTRESFAGAGKAIGSSRWYRTGDIVAMGPDGNLEYKGRTDDQIKLNGNRIELKEIENVLLQSGMVSRCAVVVQETQTEAKYLTAFITPAADYTKPRLLAAARKKLAGYMVPSKWVILENWPLTFNGKTDRKALPAAETHAGITTLPKEKGAGYIRDSIRFIWCDILAVKKVNVNDNFFDLGGNSLLLIKLAFAINDRLQTNVSALELLIRPTLKKQYTYLSSKSNRNIDTPHLPPAGFDKDEASPAQKNLFIQNRLNPSLAFPNSSATFQISGPIDPLSLEAACKKIIRQNESLRMSFSFKKTKVYKVVYSDVAFNIDYRHSLRTDIDEEIRSLTLSFDFTRAPLFRVFVITLADSRQFLHLYMPHIVSDGESSRIITEALEAIYNDAYREKGLRQYTDFQAAVYSYFFTPEYQSDKLFWKKQLSKEIRQALPLLKTALPGAKFEGVCLVLPFSRVEQEEIKDYCRSGGISLFQFLLTAWFLLLYKLTGNKDLMVMIPVHNRNAMGMDRVIGLLANVVLVRISIHPHTDVKRLITSCRNTIQQAILHQQFPFEEQLQLWKDKGRPIEQLFNFFFSYHYSRGEYRLGSATLKLHIPVRNKENLPLSGAVFETETGLILRLASALEYHNRTQLQNIGVAYKDIIRHIVRNDIAELNTIRYGKSIMV